MHSFSTINPRISRDRESPERFDWQCVMTSGYENLSKFNPSRCRSHTRIRSELAYNRDVFKLGHSTFNAGRRLCSGMHVADQALFLGISKMLWAFNICPAIDKATQSIHASQHMPKYSAGNTPMSEQKCEMLNVEWEASKIGVDEDGQWKQIPRGRKVTALWIFACVYKSNLL